MGVGVIVGEVMVETVVTVGVSDGELVTDGLTVGVFVDEGVGVNVMVGVHVGVAVSVGVAVHVGVGGQLPGLTVTVLLWLPTILPL